MGLPDLPPAEMTPRSLAALGKAFWRMAELYELNRQEQALLLGIKYNRQRLMKLENEAKIPDDPDKYYRVGHLLGIHKNLRILFPHNRELVYEWLHRKREQFGDRSALDFIKENPVESLVRIAAIRRMLDQIRCSS